MRVTSEDKTNVNPTPVETADKPRRGRKRKTATPALTAENKSQDNGDSLANMFASAEPNMPEMQSQPIDSPEEYGAAMAMESVPQPATMAMAMGSGCGNVLKAAREAQGLSIHEVCSQLRLGVKQIQAIEQDDFDKLPQPSIVRGFIRNYARLLNIDVQPVLEAYQRIVPNKAPLPLSVRSNASPSVIDQPAPTFRPQRLITLLIFLILAGIAAYFYVNHIKPQALKDASLALDVGEISETTEQEIAMPAPDITPAPPVTEPASTGSENGGGSSTDTQATDTETQTPNASSEVTPAQPATSMVNESTIVSTPTPATTQAAESTTIKATDPQKANLQFKVSEDSWVRIEDMQGKKVFSEVLPAGSERQVVTEKPVNITVGHAAGTQLIIDNQPYDLTQATRGRVARIQLK
jgi:cytoskeleton protein RodZ